MNKSINYLMSTMLLLSMLALTGCNDSSGLKSLKDRNIKKVAIISVRTDSRLHTKNQGRASSLQNLVQDVSRGGLEGNQSKRLTEDEQFFLFKMMEDLQKPFNNLLDSYQIARLSKEELINSNSYNNIPITASEDGIYYSIPPYRNIDQPNADVLSGLCRDLKVDAVLTYRSYFEREAYRDMFQLPLIPDNLKFFAKLDIMVFDKTGQTIFQKRYEAVSPEIIGFDKSQYQFSFLYPEMKRVIERTVDILKSNINLEISMLKGNNG